MTTEDFGPYTNEARPKFSKEDEGGNLSWYLHGFGVDVGNEVVTVM